MEIIFGVPVGVSLGVIYGLMENFCTACRESVEKIDGSAIEIYKQNHNSNRHIYTCEAKDKRKPSFTLFTTSVVPSKDWWDPYPFEPTSTIQVHA